MFTTASIRRTARRAAIFFAVLAFSATVLGGYLLHDFDPPLGVAAQAARGLRRRDQLTDQTVRLWVHETPESQTVAVVTEDAYSVTVKPAADQLDRPAPEDNTIVVKPLEETLGVRHGPQTYENFIYLEELPLHEDLQAFTFARCQELGLDYPLVLALMWRESGFQPHAVHYNDNGTWDSGIMQINDVNREWLLRECDISDLLDPYQNISAGTTILSKSMSEHGDLNLALMAYQYGENGMRDKVSQGITTSRQVGVALDMRDYYRQLLAQTQAVSV